MGMGFEPLGGAEGQWVTSRKVMAGWQRHIPVSPGWWGLALGCRGDGAPRAPMGGHEGSTNAALNAQTPLGSVVTSCPCVPAPLGATSRCLGCVAAPCPHSRMDAAGSHGDGCWERRAA